MSATTNFIIDCEEKGINPEDELESLKEKLITEVKCPSCGFTLRYIPAGTSKEGKAYDEFWVCDNKKDKYGLPCENKFNKWQLFKL